MKEGNNRNKSWRFSCSTCPSTAKKTSFWPWPQPVEYWTLTRSELPKTSWRRSPSIRRMDIRTNATRRTLSAPLHPTAGTSSSLLAYYLYWLSIHSDEGYFLGRILGLWVDISSFDVNISKWLSFFVIIWLLHVEILVFRSQFSVFRVEISKKTSFLSKFGYFM